MAVRFESWPDEPKLAPCAGIYLYGAQQRSVVGRLESLFREALVKVIDVLPNCREDNMNQFLRRSSFSTRRVLRAGLKQPLVGSESGLRDRHAYRGHKKRELKISLKHGDVPIYTG